MDSGMIFETAMHYLFGDKAYQIASTESSPRERKKWIRKAIKKLYREVENLDTTSYHKQVLMGQLEGFSDSLNNPKLSAWDLVYHLIRFSSNLIGLGHNTPAYYQTPDQYYMTQSGDHLTNRINDQRTILSIRQSLISDLQRKGISIFKISLIFNTTEYQINKTIRELNPKLSRKKK